jgi:hypothetical protein
VLNPVSDFTQLESKILDKGGCDKATNPQAYHVTESFFAHNENITGLFYPRGWDINIFMT